MQKTSPTTSQTLVNQNTTINSTTNRPPRTCYKCGERYFPGPLRKAKSMMTQQGDKSEAALSAMQSQNLEEGEEEWHNVLKGNAVEMQEEEHCQCMHWREVWGLTLLGC